MNPRNANIANSLRTDLTTATQLGINARQQQKDSEYYRVSPEFQRLIDKYDVDWAKGELIGAYRDGWRLQMNADSLRPRW